MNLGLRKKKSEEGRILSEAIFQHPVSVVVLFVAGSLFAMAAQEPAKTIQTVEAKPTATMNGEEMF